MRQYRIDHKEQIDQKRRENIARKKAERIAAEQTAKENVPAELKQDEAYQAALINEKHRFTFVCGAAYSGRSITVIERLRLWGQISRGRYRVKRVTYAWFPTLDDAAKYCQSKGIRFEFLSDHQDPSEEGPL